MDNTTSLVHSSAAMAYTTPPVVSWGRMVAIISRGRFWEATDVITWRVPSLAQMVAITRGVHFWGSMEDMWSPRLSLTKRREIRETSRRNLVRIPQCFLCTPHLRELAPISRGDTRLDHDLSRGVILLRQANSQLFALPSASQGVTDESFVYSSPRGRRQGATGVFCCAHSFLKAVPPPARHRQRNCIKHRY